MKNLTAIEKIDCLLNYFYSEKSRQVIFSDISQHFKIDNGLVREILDRLINDGHVKEFKQQKPVNPEYHTYSITFNGRIFKEAGGYKEDQKARNTLFRKKRIQNVLLTCGTVAAGLYGIFEIIKWIFHHEHWKAFF
jgi:hypothetical protein